MLGCGAILSGSPIWALHWGSSDWHSLTQGVTQRAYASPGAGWLGGVTAEYVCQRPGRVVRGEPSGSDGSSVEKALADLAAQVA